MRSDLTINIKNIDSLTIDNVALVYTAIYRFKNIALVYTNVYRLFNLGHTIYSREKKRNRGKKNDT